MAKRRKSRTHYSDVDPAWLTQEPGPEEIWVEVTANVNNVLYGEQVQLRADVWNTGDTRVRWSTTGGTISPTGLFTASQSGSITVTATCLVDETISDDFAITVEPITVTLTPASVELARGDTQQFLTAVVGTPDTRVIWAATGGSINSTGFFSATESGSFTATATSVVDPSSTGTAAVEVETVNVSLSPTSKTLLINQTEQFTATVIGALNSGVTWSTDGGSVSPTGLYTATTNGLFTVTARSVQDTTKAASALVDARYPIDVSITPATITLNHGATQQFTATVANAINTNVTWSATGGSINNGLFTASESGTFTLTATSVEDPTKTSTAIVTVATVAVTVSPDLPVIDLGASQQFTANVTGAANTAVTWSTSGGSITTGGLFTGSSGTYTITATSVQDPTKTGTTSVTVRTVAVTVTPETTTAQINGRSVYFTKNVTGAVSTAVTWTNSGGGTLNADANGAWYYATSSGDYTVTATSVQDNTKSDTSTVHNSTNLLVNGPLTYEGSGWQGWVTSAQGVTPSVNYADLWTYEVEAAIYEGGAIYQDVRIASSGTFTLTFDVSNVTGSGGTYEVLLDSVQVSTGTLTTTETRTVNFTMNAGTCRVRFSAGTGATDAVRVDEVTLNQGTYTSVGVTVTPPSVVLDRGATQQFTATVTGATDTSVTWSATGGSINGTGLFTASASGNFTVTATSVENTGKSHTASIQVATPNITVTPAAALLAYSQTQQYTATVTGLFSTAVTWSATGGTISGAGLFTAGSTAGDYSITATSVQDGAVTGVTEVTIAAVAANLLLNSAFSTGTSWQNAGTNLATISGGAATIYEFYNEATYEYEAGSIYQTVQLPATNRYTLQFDVTSLSSPTQLRASVVTGAGPFTYHLDTTVDATGTYTIHATDVIPAGTWVTVIFGIIGRNVAQSITIDNAVFGQKLGVTISPRTASLSSGATQQFTTYTSGLSNTAVTWGTTGGGSVDGSGLFTATTSGAATVTATSVENGSYADTANITVQAVAVSVNPLSASINRGATQQFTATVTGTGNTAVTWSATGGSINGSGLFTGSTSGTFTITATSVADNTKSASATITVATIVITVSPNDIVLQPSGTQQFTATVTGAADPSVWWSANGGAMNTSTGFFTAGSGNFVYTIEAISNMDATCVGTATVRVSNLSVSLSTTSAYGSCGRTTSGSCTATTNSVTVTPANGIAPYTYQWWYESGSTANHSSTSATTTFSRSGSVGSLTNPDHIITGYYHCTVTDATGTSRATAAVNVTTDHERLV